MRKTVAISILLVILSSINLFSQKLSSSPLSRYGIGDIYYQGNNRQLAMGQTGIGNFSALHISKLNPAGISAIRPNNVIFEFGIFHKMSDYNTGIDNQTNNISNFKHLFGGFRITPWWHTAFGLTPYSGVGYQIVYEDSLYTEDNKTSFTTSYSGFGGITQLFWINSFTFLKNFSVGATINYNFGSIDRNTETLILDSLATSVTYTKSRNIFKKFNYNFGLIYQDTIKKGYDNILRYSIGGVFSNKTNIKTNQTLYIWREFNAYNLTHSDSLFFDTVSNSQITLPQTIGGGLSLTFKESYTFTADYLYRKWKGNSILGENNFANSQFIGVGFEFCQDRLSTTYYKTIRYRIGAFNKNTYKIFNDNQINTQAVTIGLGFPVKTIQLNLGFVYGKTGSIDIGLEENFYEFNLSLSLYDLWFVKRKFM